MKFTIEQAATAGYDTKMSPDYWERFKDFELEGEWEIVPVGVNTAANESTYLSGFTPIRPTLNNTGRAAVPYDPVLVKKVPGIDYVRAGYTNLSSGYQQAVAIARVPFGYEVVPVRGTYARGDSYIDYEWIEGPGYQPKIVPMRDSWIGLLIEPHKYVAIRPKSQPEQTPSAPAAPPPEDIRVLEALAAAPSLIKSSAPNCPECQRLGYL